MRTASGTGEVQLFGNDREATQLIQLEHREHRCKTWIDRCQYWVGLGK